MLNPNRSLGFVQAWLDEHAPLTVCSLETLGVHQRCPLFLRSSLTSAPTTKTVIYYYDATALGSNYAVNDQDFHWVVVHEFERHGWQVIDVYLGNPMRHDEKYLLINQGFAGKQRREPEQASGLRPHTDGAG